jgi:hypothetical protein
MATEKYGVHTSLQTSASVVPDRPELMRGIQFFMSEKGPDNEILFIQNSNNYISIYGTPNIDIYGENGYIAENWLALSALNCVRILPTAARYSYMLFGIKCSGTWPSGPFSIDGDFVVIDPSSCTFQGSSKFSDGLTIDEIESLFEPGSTDEYVQVKLDGTNDSVCKIVGLIYGTGRGAWYNNSAVSISDSTDWIQTQSGYRDSSLPKFNLTVQDGDVTRSMIASTLYDDTLYGRIFVEDVINANCTYWKAKFLHSFNGDTIVLGYKPSATLFAVSTITSEGTNGWDTSDIYTQYSTALSTYLTAATQLLNKNAYRFMFTLDADLPEGQKAVINNLLVSVRKDLMYMFSLQYRKAGLVSDGDFTTVPLLGKELAAAYDVYSQISDTNTSKNIWVSEMYFMPNIIFNVVQESIKQAYAGIKRATIAAQKVNCILSDAQEIKYRNNAVNYIVYMKDSNKYVVYGNKTRFNSPNPAEPKNYVNQMMIYLSVRHYLEAYANNFIFETIDDDTLGNVNKTVETYMTNLANKQVVFNPKWDVSATDQEFLQKRFHIWVAFKPAASAEDIDLYIVMGDKY